MFPVVVVALDLHIACFASTHRGSWGCKVHVLFSHLLLSHTFASWSLGSNAESAARVVSVRRLVGSSVPFTLSWEGGVLKNLLCKRWHFAQPSLTSAGLHWHVSSLVWKEEAAWPSGVKEWAPTTLNTATPECGREQGGEVFGISLISLS